MVQPKHHQHRHLHQIRNSGRLFAPINTPFVRRLETLAVLVMLVSLPLIHALIFWIIYLAFWGTNPLINSATKIFLMIYIVYYIYDFKKPFSGEVRGSQTFLKLMSPWITKYKSYFPITPVMTDECSDALRKLKESPRSVIFASHPHGIFAAGTVVNMVFDRFWFEERFPHINLNMGILSRNMIWPIWREWLLAWGFVSVERKSCERVLRGTDNNSNGQSNGLVIAVGGAKEALDAGPGKMDLTVNCRNGFFKLALSHGVLLVPMLCFGENDMYAQVQHPVINTFQSIGRKIFAFSIPIFFGRGVFNYRFGWLPQRVPITTVLGPPIDIKKIEDPNEEEIAELRSQYVQALEKLYNDYKDKYETIHNPNGLRIVH